MLRFPSRRALTAVPAAALLVLLAGCVRNPATGERQFTLISEAQEIRLGQDYDVQMVAELGLYPDSALQRYVHELGTRMAALSERPHLPWTFRVVDDPIVNAFALPGGYIYLTRGILAHLNSEAELAAVIGHEIGHVTARHSVSRISTQQVAGTVLGVGTVLFPELEPVAGVAGVGLSLVFLRYGREDERQADDLGLRYMVRAGYDPREMPGVFSILEAVSEAAGGNRIPEWLSSHPDPGNRRERITAQVAQLAAELDELTVGRADYLHRLDGLVFGDNPREGFFRGAEFLHPDLAFRMVFPSGWQTHNLKQAVIAVSPDRDAVVQLTLSREATPDAAARQFYRQQGVTGGPARATTINGLPAATGSFSAQTRDGPLWGGVAFIAHGSQVFQLLGYGTEARWRAHQTAVVRTIESFDRLTDRSALDVQPLRVRVATVDREMTLEEFARLNSPTVGVDVVALLNNLRPSAVLVRGQLVKVVVGQRPPGVTS